MSARVGINGFGRMGRLALRASWNAEEFDYVLINEPKATVEVSTHLLEFDSVHGRFSQRLSCADGGIELEGARLAYTQSFAPADVPWTKHGVDIVLECSGKFRTPESLRPYFDAGVKKVIVAAPVKSGALNVVMGVNHHLYEPESHSIVTAASCTTNCLAPVVKVLHESVGIRHGLITTIHDVTNTQNVVDAPHTDLRRARSCLQSLIPTSTGSATAIGLIYPELAGRLNGIAVRVPLLNASLTDCVFELERKTSVEEVNALFEVAANTPPLQGILGFERRPLVSVDYVNDTRSAIVDGLSSMVVNGTQLKVLAWYDNEIGYVNRMSELLRLVATRLS